MRSAATTGTAIELVLNGGAIAVDRVPPHTTLLDFLRSRGLTGAKEGCAEGECGACTVATVTDVDGRTAYRAVNSCLMLLPMAAGQEVYTVEALARHGLLAEVQEAMAAAGGSQCGYCTPGFVMSLFTEQYRVDREGPCDPLAMAGNLCRCTGYRPIRDAALALGPAPPGVFRDRLETAAPRVKPIAIEGFSRPRTVEECVAILSETPGAALVAGGTDLVVDVNLRHRRWPLVISLEAIEELHDFAETPDRIRIGAALTLTDIGRRWRQAPDVLAGWLALFASPPIRNRATLGGNLATASPIGDGAPLLLALDASAHIAGPGGRRAMPLASFFPGYRQTALQPGEILTAIEIPKPLPEVTRFYKVSKRRLDDISTVAAAMSLDRDGTRRVRRARFAFGGVAGTPIRVLEAEAAVEGQFWNEPTSERVQHVLDRALVPLTDHRGSKAYRLEVSKSLVERFHWECGQ
jgi:xanthine dehydrogenase small subunit